MTEATTSWNQARGEVTTRRSTALIAAGTIAAAFVAATAFGAEQKVAAPAVAPANGPNILMIVTDDQRVNSLGYMPQTKRWFVSGGRRYTRAVATNPLCCPSRASIFSGDYSHNHGVLTNEDALELDQSTTVQAALQSAGYQTFISGKYLNDWDVAVDPPHFDQWAIFADDSTTVNLYRNETWSINGSIEKQPEYTTQLVHDYALDFLEQSEADDDRPWLLYMFPFAPHAPYTPDDIYSDADVGTWKGNPAVFGSRRDKPPWVRSEHSSLKEGRKIRKGQLRTLMSVDDVVGDVMEALGEMGERSNTLAVFTSDNGLHWGEYGLTVKRFPYKPSFLVPLILRWPGKIVPGTTSNKLVANIDLAPTALDAAGQPDPATDGRSLLDPGKRDRLLMESWASNLQSDDLPDWAATYTGDSQYTEYYNESEELIFREYFDLKADPYQLDNLLRDGNPDNNPDVGDLSAELGEDRVCEGMNCP
jgi:arylsulfatase A-like enzyme